MNTIDNPLRVAAELARQGKTREAIDCLESTLAPTRMDKERPANTSALARMAGLLSAEAGSLPQAAVYYEEAAAAEERDPLTLLALADIRWRLGEAEAARSCLARAEFIAQSASDSDALQIVANVRARWTSDS